MRTRRATWLAGIPVILALMLAMAGCSGSGSDKAGGAVKAEPRVLTLANQTGSPPVQLDAFAKEVARLSNGTLEIAFENGWRQGDPHSESGTLEDVKAGKVDMAWVGARIFDTAGVTSFQALLAPLLVDSYDLEAKVFDAGIPEQMLAGVSNLDLVGISVLPGPMRKMLGVAKPFLRPGDFAGQVVGVQDSELTVQTLRTLAARPRSMPSAAALDGVDGYEQQLSSIAGNSYDETAEYVTANLNLWPRPLVTIMGKKVFESLTAEQQRALKEAAKAAIPAALAASRAEDEEAVGILCRRGMTFATASDGDISELRNAFEPIYADLAADPDTRSYLDAIGRLKTETAASAEAPACAPDSETAEPAKAAIPDGTYEAKVTREDWLAAGGSGEEVSPGEGIGLVTMVFDNGELTIVQPNGQIGFRATYSVFRDQIEAHGTVDTVTARWSLDGKSLSFTDVLSCEGSPCTPTEGPAEGVDPYAVTWESHPWVPVTRKQTPIDGVYEFTTTLEDFEATSSPDIVVENYGHHRWVLDGGRFEMRQKNGASDRWTKGSYVVRGNIVEFTVEDYGGIDPTGAAEKPGEVFTYSWSLYRDQLALGPVEGAISPENFRAKPWTRVD